MRGGDLHLPRTDWWPPTKRPQATPGGLIAAVLGHVPSFGRDPRGSPDFLAYPVPKACMHVLGTGSPRCLGVARSASSFKAAQALGCSLTPGLRISFGLVTCMAQAASVPGLWTMGTIGTAAPHPTRHAHALPAATAHRQWKGTIPTGGALRPI